MPRRRKRLNWPYNEERQEFTTPSGRIISLHEIAAILQDQISSTRDFAGPWAGWRMRQNRLIPPSTTFRNSQITPHTLRAFNRWLASYQGEQAQLEFHTGPNRQTGQPQPACPPSFADTESPNALYAAHNESCSL